jgi:hypothetical protein
MRHGPLRLLHKAVATNTVTAMDHLLRRRFVFTGPGTRARRAW